MLFTSRYQKNTGRRACIFLLLLIIFGLVLVLIFKPRRHGRLPDTNHSSEGDTTSSLPVSVLAAPEAMDDNTFNTLPADTDTDRDVDADLGLLPPLPMVTPDLSGFGLGNRNRKRGRGGRAPAAVSESESEGKC